MKWFNESKGYGFIAHEDGGEVFVHYKAIAGEALRKLDQGQRVEFEIREGPKGPQAQNVRVLGAADRVEASQAAVVPNATGDRLTRRSDGRPRDDRPSSGREKRADGARLARRRLPVREQVVSALGDLDVLPSCHLGLRFFKYVDAWSQPSGAPRKGQWTLEADDKTVFFERRDAAGRVTGGVTMLNEALKSGEGAALLSHAHCRFDRLLASMAEQDWAIKSTVLRTAWRFVSGLGISHPFETGLAFHHTFGVPFLPGSSVKGAAAAWAKENRTWKRDIFGTERASGQVVFFDALPTSWPALELDIINPHYSSYYEGTDPPADWLSPNPIHFLAVAPNQPFKFVVAARTRRAGTKERTAQELLTAAITMVENAATSAGLGGKSAVGYGYFA